MDFIKGFFRFHLYRIISTTIFLAFVFGVFFVLQLFDIDIGLEETGAVDIEPSASDVQVLSEALENSEENISLLPTEALPAPTEIQVAAATVDPTPTVEQIVDATDTAEPINIVEVNLDDRPLPAEWYLDNDFNGIPNFLELELGLDPFAEDCVVNYCTANLPPPPDQTRGGSLTEFTGNIMIILDASGSMGDPMGNKTRMQAAQTILQEYVAEIPQTAEVGLIVYGHQGDGTDAGKPASCAGVEVIGELGAISAANIETTLSNFEPNGWTPIGDALNLAYANMQNGASNNKIVLVTDGLETCESDPIAIAATIAGDPAVDFAVDVVGFGIQSTEERAILQEIAASGNGQYINVNQEDDFRQYTKDLVNYVRASNEFQACASRTHTNHSACYSPIVNDASTKLSNSIAALDDKAAQADLKQIQGRLRDWLDMHSEFNSAYFDRFRPITIAVADEELWGYIDLNPENVADAQPQPYLSPVAEGGMMYATMTIDRPADCAPGTGQDFSGQTISGSELENQDLRNGNFRESVLNLASLAGSDLTCADFRGARIIESDLSDTLLNWAILADSTVAGTDFIRSQMEAIDLAGADFSDIDFTRSVLTGAHTAEARFSTITWSYSTCPDGFWVGRDGKCHFP